MTTKMVKRIAELAKEGFCDAEISRRTGQSYTVVRYWREKLGVPLGEKGKRSYPPKRYTVYRKQTSEYLCEGTIREIAAALELKYSGMKSIVHRTLKGKLGKYEFYEVEEAQYELGC